MVIGAAFLLCGPAHAQTASDSLFDTIARRGINDVYNLEFERADSEFAETLRLRPSSPEGHFFLAMVDWWRILIDIDNTSLDKRFYKELDDVIDLCDSLLDVDKRNVNAIFFKGGAIGFEGRLRFHRDDYLSAANAGRKALGLIHDAMALDPGNADVLLGAGMYNYYAEVIPEEYPYLKPLLLFIPSGDKKKGIEQLTEASRKGKYASVEATYFLMQLYYYYEKDYSKALALATELHGRFPRNMLFHKYLGRCEVALSHWQEGFRVFSDIVARTREKKRGYTAPAEREAEYYMGYCKMNMGDLGGALQEFYRCDELSRTLDRTEESGFMVMANLRVGMIDDLQGKRESAVQQYRKVLDMKNYLDAHEQAEKLLLSPYSQ